MGRLRPYSAAAVAVLVHAAVLVAVLRVHPRAPPPPPAEVEPVEIDVEEGRADVAREPEPRPASEPAEGQGRLAAASESTAARAATSSTPGAAERPGQAVPEVAGAPSGATSFELPGPVVPLTPGELGLAGRSNPFVSSSAVAAAERPRPAVEQATRDALHASDSVRGLGPEGPVVTALRDATSSSLAPLNGRALFDVRASADGEVLGIDIVEASGGSGWDDAKRIALEALRGKKLALPRAAKGANMRIEIVSEMSYPSGQRKKVEFGVRRGENDMPEVVLPDESNIGQRPTRKVHARAIGTDLL